MTSDSQVPMIPEPADRIAQLEGKLRSTRRLVFIWIVLVMILIWLQMQKRDVILSNGVSQVSAAFETVSDGRIGIYFFDKDHKARAELGLYPDGSPTLMLKDKDGSVLFKAP